jgi:squalene-hopene/tetraprenyl-beta-curcumene cyclase
MDDRHLRAVIRAGLRAGGFEVPMGELAAADRRMQAAGLRLRDSLLENLPGFAARDDIARLAGVDSYLWNRLPSMLAFGHQQAVVFGRVIYPERRALPAGVLLPVAVFSAGISVLDYLADQLGLAGPIFEVLDEATVAGLFGGGREAGARLREGYEQARDARLRLLFALVAVCGAGIGGLHRRHGDDQGRDDLRASFAVLHAAQKAVTFHPDDPVAGKAGADAVSAKSVLPFVAACQIVELSGPPGAAKRSGRELARQLGQAVAVTDDLVDLLADWRSGAANTIIAAARAQDGGPGVGPDDGWLYRVAGEAAAQITATLRSASLLYRPRRPAGGRPTGTEAVAKFATFTVARWVGWREELSAPSVFAARPRPARALREPCQGAAAMLLEQQRTGYREAIHWMEVPRLEGDRAWLETHPATVFQRAVVLDALLDAYVAGLQVPAGVLAREAMLLLQAKRDDVAGGWSYLPGVPELPPDVDDLAMVLQVLARAGGPPLAAAGQHALDLALAAADRGDLSTWILDPGQEPGRNEVFRRYIELTDAGGAHPEVVANLLYAASLYGTHTGKQAAAATTGYLKSAQDNDGSWPSRWYAGPHYGTYRAATALALAAPDSRALGPARDYLISGQHPDGGWGDRGHSDPLSTAFAALALAALAHPGTGRALRTAASYLLATQHPDGSWPGCPFIAFPRVGGPGIHIYSSTTITTSFCLKALLACRTAHTTGRTPKPSPIAYRPTPPPPTAADWS